MYLYISQNDYYKRGKEVVLIILARFKYNNGLLICYIFSIIFY